MGFLSLLLACRASLVFSRAAARRNGPTPPHPLGTGSRCASALLLAMAVISLQTGARADSVYLQTQTQTTTSILRFVGTNTQEGFTYVDRTEDFGTYSYVRGSTYTNHIWQDYRLDKEYGTNYKDNVAGYTRVLSTNAASAPWVNGELDYGTQRDFGTYVEHRWWTNALDTNWINSNWDVPSSNYLATYDDAGAWPMVNWSYALTNYSPDQTEERQETASVVSIAMLATSGGTNGSALFCLTGSVTDVGAGVPLTNGWTLLNKTPDAQGRVFAVLGNGTTTDVTVALDTSLTNSVTNWQYSVGASRVDLGMQWKGPNDTNWSSGALYVLKDTTVQFRVTTPGFTGVVWPTGTPAWSNGESNTTQISMTFNTVSSDTNGQWVTVTAGSMASNRVVVFDYEVQFTPEEAGAFPGRATYPTSFGVGEGVNYIAVFDPLGITTNSVGGIGWSASGMSTQTPELDRSVTNSASMAIGAFRETNSIIGTLLTGVSAGASRTNSFSVVRPTNAVLRDVFRWVGVGDETHSEGFLYAWPAVGHTNNAVSCSKRAGYFLEPADVSFHNIKAREGAGPYAWTGVPAGDGTNISVALTNAGGTQVAQLELGLGGVAQHTPWTNFKPVLHPVEMPDEIVKVNWFATDRFAGSLTHNSVPNQQPHVPVIFATLIGTIDIEFTFSVGVYQITPVSSEREYFSNGAMTIRKAGSGSHTKQFADPTSSD